MTKTETVNIDLQIEIEELEIKAAPDYGCTINGATDGL